MDAFETDSSDFLPTVDAADREPSITDASPERGVFTVDARRLDAIRAALADAHADDVRHAARHGHPTPDAPILAVEATWEYLVCERCRSVGEILGTPSGPDGCAPHVTWRAASAAEWLSPCCRFPVRHHTSARVRVTCGRPTLGAWELVAVIEPQPNDFEGKASPNLIRAVPGTEHPISGRYRTDDGTWCDHCQSARRRNETFLIVNTESGREFQVGRNCLAAFLGGVPFEGIVRRLAWFEKLMASESDGEGGGWGRGREGYEIEKVMALTACVVRSDGWLSKSKARDIGGDHKATAVKVSYVLNPPWGEVARREWRKEVERLAPEPGDMERATAALAWVRSELQPRSDYEHTIVTAGRLAMVEPRTLGIVCSIYPAHQRHIGREIERRAGAARAKAPTVWYGAVGDKVGAPVGKGKAKRPGPGIVGAVERVMAVEGNYGTTTLIVIRGETLDADGACVLVNWWKSGAADDSLNVGDRVEIRGTVKKHETYTGRDGTLNQRVTVMTRCTVEKLS